MNCPNCQAVNPTGAKFCLNCGTALPAACSNCGTALPAGAKFCFNCGQPVAATAPPTPAPPAPAAAPAKTPLQQYIPAELMAKLESARTSGGMEGERRVVTMLFCDVKGSTAAASQMDPEEWAEIINGAFAHMIAPVYRYEGTVARLMGDGLLAFFGAPIAHEDDPQRAILAGLGIVEAIQGYREEVQRRWGFELDVRVGINTGLVVVGAVGSDLRLEYTALGDAINLAARMEQTAQPGTVQVAEATHRLVAPLFDFETLHGIEVKGRAEPVTAYRVLSSRASGGRPGSVRGIAGLRAPLVARDRELATLLAAAEGLAAGRGQIVSVMGEAGLGKSRLVAELRDALATAPQRPTVQWIEGRSLSYETTTPYAPFVGMLAHCLGVDTGARRAGSAQAYDQILAQMDALFPGRGDEAAPFLATLLGIQPPGDHADRVKYLDPPTLRGMTFGHVAAFFERLAAERPLALFIDDVHWIDPTSLDLLLSLLPLTERAPLLIIAAFRPRQQEPSWQLHESAQRDFGQRYTALALQPLDLEQSRTLVAHLLHVEDLPEQVRRLILEKAEGNPFFVEEVIRSLLDAQLVVRDNGHWRATREIVHIAVPDTLNGVIAARLDRLDDRTRHIVQAAAVLGREFSHDILIDVCREPEWLDGALAELLRRDLVREKSPLPGRLYSFKHVLTQEAAYQSALLSKRRELHRRAAESMAARQGATPDQPGEIARHFLEARFPAQALPYLVEAGDRAARAYSSAEAIGFYQRAIELRAAVEGVELVGRAYEGLGGVQAFANQIPDALDTYRAMLALGEQAGDVALQISALNKLAGVTALRMGQFAEAEQCLARADRLARQHDEQSGVAESAIIRCQMCTAMADFDSVIHHMDELTAIGERIGSKEHQAMGLEHVASSLMFLARLDEAWLKAQEALHLAREIGDREHESWLLCTTIPVCLIRSGQFDAARSSLAEGLEVAGRIHSLNAQIYGNYLLGEMARWQGKYEQAVLYGQRSLEAGLSVEPFMPFMTVQPLGSLGAAWLDISEHFSEQAAELHQHALRLLESPAGVSGGGTAWADVGFCALALGDLEIAEASFEKGLNVPTMFMRLERPRHLAGLALVEMQRGRPEHALTLAEDAQAYVAEMGMRHLAPLVQLMTGRVHAGRGEFEQAVASFSRAETEAAALAMLPTVWQAQAGAAAALVALDQPAAAAEKRQAAQSIINAIAARFHDTTLRDSFRANALAKLDTL